MARANYTRILSQLLVLASEIQDILNGNDVDIDPIHIKSGTTEVVLSVEVKQSKK